MVGHSKWSKVQHITGPLGVKRGAAFGKLVKEITVPARFGGGDLSGNPCLPPVVKTACDQPLPEENSERARRKGAGELDVANDEESLDEGGAPGGVAFVVKP